MTSFTNKIRTGRPRTVSGGIAGALVAVIALAAVALAAAQVSDLHAGGAGAVGDQRAIPVQLGLDQGAQRVAGAGCCLAKLVAGVGRPQEHRRGNRHAADAPAAK